MPKKRGGDDNRHSRMRGSENGVGWQQKLRNRYWRGAGKDHEQQQNLEEKRPIQTDALLNSVEMQKPPKGNE
jgi:hypothetical protein